MDETGGAYFLALGGGNEIGKKCLLLAFPREQVAVIVDVGVKMLPKSDNPDNLAIPDLKALKPVLGPGWKIYLVITHAHADHALLGPLLKNLYPELMALATAKTLGVFAVMGEDGIKIREEAGLPAHYSRNELGEFLDSAYPIRSTDWKELERGFAVRFIPAGHIQGAASVLIKTPYGIFADSGDISFFDTTTTKGASLELEDRIRWLSIESTNGDINLENPKQVLDELVKDVFRVIQRGGNVLIPAFAVGRGLDVGIHLGRELAKHRIPVYSGGLLRKATEACCNHSWESDLPFKHGYHKDYKNQDVFDLCNENIYWVHGQNLDCVAYQKKKCVVVIPSGMLEAGYSQGFLYAWANDPRNAIFLPGYQAKGTLGRQLLETNSGGELAIYFPMSGLSKIVKIRAEVKRYQLSGHAGSNQLAEWIGNMRPQNGKSLDKVILVHGEEIGQAALGEKLRALPKAPKQVLVGVNGQVIPLL